MKQTSLKNRLFKHSQSFFSDPKKHLNYLLQNKDRFNNFSISAKNIFYDFSRQLIDKEAFDLLIELAVQNKILQKFHDMVNGKNVNKTENRPALHTLCRNTGSNNIFSSEIDRVKKEISEFTEKIHNNEISSSSGKQFTDLCILGIGGSSLGSDFVIQALSRKKKLMKPYFIESCDPNEFADFLSSANLETTLFLVISKSFKTSEILLNESVLKKILDDNNLDYKKHMVRVTCKNSRGDQSDSDLKVFHIFNWIGGRYSVSSAVGGLPISLVYGFDVFEKFLLGMNDFDNHALEARPEKNIPFAAAMIDIWNSTYLNLPGLAMVPYSKLLHKLPSHIQQLYMESNGKTINEQNEIKTDPAAMVIFGDTGTKAQHSFFQLLHQGRVVPSEFTGILDQNFQDPTINYTDMQNELWANLLAQADSLATGNNSDILFKKCPGNRPSSIITMENAEPENIGKLLSFYESRTVLAGFLWGINPFDQFGVEAGKNLATEKRQIIHDTLCKNTIPENVSDSDRFYCTIIKNKKIQPL